MSPAILQQPFIQITLPILIGFIGIGVWQNRRLDDIVSRLLAIENKLGKIEDRIGQLAERITRVEERTSPVFRP